MADPRGFRYPLKPLALKAEWDVNDTLSDLAVLNAQIEQVRREADVSARRIGELQEFRRRQVGANARIDPGAEQMAFRFLARLEQTARALDEQRRQLDTQHAQLSELLAQRRNYADGIDKHRVEAVGEYRKQLADIHFKDADDIWLQRLIWRQAQ